MELLSLARLGPQVKVSIVVDVVGLDPLQV